MHGRYYLPMCTSPEKRVALFIVGVSSPGVMYVSGQSTFNNIQSDRPPHTGVIVIIMQGVSCHCVRYGPFGGRKRVDKLTWGDKPDEPTINGGIAGAIGAG